MQHWTAMVDALGTGEEPSWFRATLEITQCCSVVATDTSPFWAMCELKKALERMGVSGITLEGFFDDEPIFDPFGAHGVPLAGRRR